MTPAEHTIPIPRGLHDAFDAHGGEVEDTAQLAALSGLREAEVEVIVGDPVRFAALQASRAAYEMKGKHLPRRVHKLTEAVVDMFEKQIAAGLDMDLGLELIKPLIRLMEIAERTRLAEKDYGDRSKLAVFHFIINGVAQGGAQKPKDVSDVIDVQAVQVPTITGGAS